MLAVVWGNDDLATNGFDAEFGADAEAAAAVVYRAIDDWNRLVTSFNYAVDSDADPNNDLDDTFTLTLSADEIAGRGVTTSITYGADLRPFAATIVIDDDAAGEGWYIDATPWDDAEFSAAVAPFEANFVDASTAGQAAVHDLYRTVMHELGHALGIGLADTAALDSGLYPYFSANGTPVTNPNSANSSDLIYGALAHKGIDQTQPLRVVSDPDGTPNSGDETYAINELWEYSLGGGAKVTFTEADGGHFYDGAEDPNFTGITTHPNELMAVADLAIGSPATVARQFVSDTAIDLLVDAFGYTAVSPAASQDLASGDFSAGLAQVSFEPHGGTLVVQGLYWDPTAATNAHVDDTISITEVGSEVRVSVSYTLDSGDSYSFTRDIATDRVAQIIVAGNGGTDSVTIGSGLAAIVREVDYIVSSNEDADDPGTLGDGVVDLDAVAPGAQIGLRSALRDANASGGVSSIYVAPNPGHHVLNRSGSESNNAAYNDLDITEDANLYGAGAGVSVVDASGMSDRVFSINGGSEVAMSGLTITGGDSTGGGGGILVNTGSDLTLTRVAVVDNESSSTGGGLLALSPSGSSQGTTSVTIDGSIFTGNTSATYGGGVAGEQSGTHIEVGQSVFVENTASTSRPNVAILNGASAQNNGDNLVGEYTGSLFAAGAGDIVNGTPDYVVTTVSDEFDASNDAHSLSLRGAIDAANDASGAEEVWLPAWDYLLTLQRTTQPTDTDAAFGDLDIADDLTIRRAGSLAAAVRWADSAHTDKTFEVLGDYNGDLSTDIIDYNVWRDNLSSSGSDPDEWENLPGDGDDDDDVDSADYQIWISNYGVSLTLDGVS